MRNNPCRKQFFLFLQVTDFTKEKTKKLSQEMNLAVSKNDFRKINELLIMEPNLFQYPESDSLRRSLLVKCSYSNDAFIIKSFLNFLKNVKFIFDDIEDQYLIQAIEDHKILFVDFLFSKGAKMNCKVIDLAEQIFDLKFINTRLELLQIFRKHKIDLHGTNKHNETLIQVFMKFISSQDKDDTKIIQILIDSGINNFNIVDSKHFSCVHRAVISNNVNVVKLLIQNGADINKKNVFLGSFPLESAVCAENHRMVKCLLRNGADVLAKNEDGDTALHSTNVYFNKKIIRLLIMHGSQISVLNNKNESVLTNYDDEEDDDKLKIYFFLKQLAIKEVSGDRISKNDRLLINATENTRLLFKNCLTELKFLNSTSTHKNNSFFNLIIKKKIDKSTLLSTKKKDFIKKYNDCLEHLIIYSQALRHIVKKARKKEELLNKVILELSFIFKNFLPDLVIRKTAEYIIWPRM